jgi:hypothetical protein
MKNKNIIIMVVVYAVILILIGVFQPREIDWTPTFAAHDKIPYGTFVARERLADIFPDSIKTVNESIYKTLHKNHFTQTNYILIEPQWNASRSDVRELLNFAADGNNVFIASQNIPFRLLDTIGIHLQYAIPNFLQKITKTDTSSSLPVTLVNPEFGKDSLYEFETNNIPEYFSAAIEPVVQDSNQVINDDEEIPVHDSTQAPLAQKAQILSTVSDTNPIFIRVPVGKGFIYLHSYPFAFTNYYLLKDSTRGYAEHCLSYLPKGKVFWDEHYKTDARVQHVTTLGYILHNPSLRWGYFTGIAFLLIFVIFSIKRRQRIIPVVAPFRNTTLEFTETIGRLYFNRGDAKNIAEKKIRHFHEYVRSRYYVDTNVLDAEFINKLSNKSSLEIERIQYLTQVVRALQSKQNIADSELIQLNELIEYFKKHSN